MNFVAFFIYIFSAIYSPGPNIIMGMSLANNLGPKKVWKFTLGVFIALLISFAACALFSKFLYDLIPSVEPFMYAFGGTYLLWLAYEVYRSGGENKGNSLDGKNTIKMGMVNQFMNIKNQVFGITVFSSFILPHYSSVSMVLIFVISLSIFAISAIYTWIYVGTSLFRNFQKHRKAINTVMALSLVYCAITMFLALFNSV